MMTRKILVLGIIAGVCGLAVSCSKTPEQLVARHTGKGDEYVKEKKFSEAVIEYRNAAKAGPSNAAVRWKLAQAALEARDIRTGFQELQKAIELDPRNYEALGKLGEIYAAVGKTGEAASIADNLVRMWPGNTQGYILKSVLAMKAGKVDESIGYLRKAVELDPKDVRSMLTMGNVYVIRRDRKSAMEWYDRALAADPGAPIVHVTRGNYFFSTGEREEGEREYRKAIELSKDKELLRINLAEHYLYQGRMDESEKELNAVVKEMNSQKARKMLAEIKLETGRVGDAKPIVDAILEENRKDLDGKYLKGRIALAEKRTDDAKALFEEVVKQDARMSRAHLYNGIAEIVKGQVEVGKKEIMDAVRLNPDDVRARLVLAELHLKSNAPAEAEKEAVEALRRNPSNLAAAVIYGDSFLVRRDWKKAEQVYQAMIRQMPDKPAGYLKMGRSKMAQKKASEAAVFFGQAFERGPSDVRTLDQYVFALREAGRADQAKKILDDRLAKDPKNPALWETAGRFHIAGRKDADAESALLKAIELAPDVAAPYYDLGILYVTRNRAREAAAKFGKVVEKNDRNIGARVLLGLALNADGKIEEANKQYRRTLELAPRNVVAANNLAANLCDHGGNLDEALKFAQIAREAAPDDPSVADTLGWIYYRKGLYENAYPLIADAVKKAARNAAIRYHHGMVLAKREKTREAAAELKAALALDGTFLGAEEARKTLSAMK